MSDINNINSSAATQASTASSAASQSNRTQYDSDMFMKLLIAQLKHQDPTNPQDTTDFMAQMSSLSTVEQITNLNKTVEGFQSMLQSSVALQASSMVGRTAFVEGDTAKLHSQSGEVKGLLDLTNAVSNVQIGVFSSTGEQVASLSLGDLAAGEHSFNWQAGNTLPPGNYTFKAQGSVGGQNTSLKTYMGVNVDSVSFSGTSGMTLNLGNGQSASVASVKRVG
ncbi:flagellar hook assembly protein FlgD [Balneatrix alpica]|uniref:Basal-body rod modification protein FlgD n=1 Tax=Balneatrix alpica TaxID=75684 RepID=A0ABV5ZGN1_9GAMM|nr:flagellar hook capping FlgD N-terminal domain-containing protein [Balneatrix alpica]